MAFNNIPGIRARFGDQFFQKELITDQPKIVVLGFGSSGRSYELRNVGDISSAESYYGRSSEVAKGIHQVFSQGASNIATMRLGGTIGTLTLTDSAGGTLLIETTWRDDNALSRYNLIIEQSSNVNRYIIYDNQEETYIYDSDEVLVQDVGYISITDTDFARFTVGDRSNPNSTTTNYTLSALLALGAVGPFTMFTSVDAATVASATGSEGTDRATPSQIERYAALEAAYDEMDFKDLNMFWAEGAYIDAQNIVDDASTDTANYGYFGKGAPKAGSSADGLGYLWQYRYQGQTYTYFVDSPTYFTNVGAAVAAVGTFNTDLVLTAQKAGIGGNAHTYSSNAAGAAGPTATISETAYGLHIAVEDDGTSFTLGLVTVINTALQNFTMSNGQTADTVLVASGGGAATAIATVASTAISAGATPTVGSGPNPAVTPDLLLGDSVPAAVSTRFAAGVDSELRECNFYHQALSFAHRASTSYNMVMTAMNFKKPTTGFAPKKIGSWLGDLPSYSFIGEKEGITAPADNGSGVLGNKFFAGKSETNNGYRSSQLPDGNSTDGYKGGGWIKTKGANLPVETDWAYGIDDADEDTGFNSAPIDIGRYGIACADWPIHINSFNGGTQYRGPQAPLLLGMLATLPENVSPIGEQGAFRRGSLSNPIKLRAQQTDDLASIRLTSIIRDTNDFVNVKGDTSAHPDSDYAKITTVRSLARQLSGIRSRMKPYIGKQFTGAILQTLQQEVDRYLSDEKALGYNNGYAPVVFQYTEEERVLGTLRATIRIVPPFAIESIQLSVSLAADESDL